MTKEIKQENIFVLTEDGEPIGFVETKEELNAYLLEIFLKSNEVCLRNPARKMIKKEDDILFDGTNRYGYFYANLTGYDNLADFYPYWSHDYLIVKVGKLTEKNNVSN